MFKWMKEHYASKRASKIDTSRLKSMMHYRPTMGFNTTLILFALGGIVGCIYMIIRSGWQIPAALPAVQPPISMYKNFIATSGIIESCTDNIQLSTQTSGIVKDVLVKVGDRVKKDDPLFTLDPRQIEADIKLKESQVAQSKASLKQAEAQMKTSKDKFDIANRVKDKSAISQDDYLSRKNAYLTDKASFEAAQENLKVAEANLNSAKVNLNILTVRAPIDCDVLQVNVHPGEFASQSPLTGDYIASPTNTPLMLLGNVKNMQIRVDIDENQAWRFVQGSKAIAYLRGNSRVKLELDFDRLEPYVVPKTSLTGSSSERVDTRVLQVIYRFDPKDLPLYVGQQVDAYVDVPLEHEKKYAPPVPQKEKDA